MFSLALVQVRGPTASAVVSDILNIVGRLENSRYNAMHRNAS
jgi:hypothetical protein